MKYKDVIQANIDVHTAYAHVYNDQPHFRTENKDKVKSILSVLRQRITNPQAKMLDIGCGTGFLMHLARDMFTEVHGVDVTKAMTDQVDLSSGNVFVQNAPAEKIPHADASFDFVTAYSFMDHLFDLRPMLEEAYRVLKPGGLFYSDQNANKLFWDALSVLPQAGAYSPIVAREIKAIHPDKAEAESHGVSDQALKVAEYIKFNENGIDPYKTVQIAKEIGFREVAFSFDWFLGQGNVMHSQSFADAQTVESWLRSVQPLSGHLFKYLRFDFIK